MSKEKTPWYRQFWPWFLLVLPGTVVVASVSTVVLAVRHSDNLVVDDYYRDGLAINRYLAQDDEAKRLGLNAEIHFRGQDTISIHIAGLQNSPDHLLLHWQHPVEESLDFNTVLINEGEGNYSAQMGQFPDGRWYLTLREYRNGSADTGSWRLKSEIQLGSETQRSQTLSLSAAD